MGLFDWLKRNDVEKTPPADHVTTRSVSVGVGLDAGADAGDADGLQDPGQRAALEQVDHLVHEFLAAGGGSGSAGGLTVTQSTQVIVDGQMVSADDPRAREAMSKAAAKLRAQGLDELAADLEARVAVAPTAAAGTAPPAVPPPPGDDQSLPATRADEGLGAAPSAPAPPEPPAPPS